MLYSQDIDDGHSNSAPLQPHPPVNAVNPDQPRFIRKITDVMQLDDPSATQKQIALQEWKEGIRQQIAQKKEIDFQIKAREDFEDAQRMATKISSPTIKSIRKLEGSFSPVASPKLTLDDLQKAYYVDLGASKIPRPNHRKEPIKQDGVKLPEIVDGNKYVRGRLVKSIREPAKPRAVPKTAPSPKIESVKVGLGIKARAKTVVKEQTSSNHKHIQSITPKSIVKETYPTPVPERKRLVSNTKPKAVNTAPNSKPVHKDETITTSKPLNITKPVSDTTKKANVIHSPIQNQKTSIPEKTVHSPNPPQLPSDKPPLGKIDKPKSILHPTKNAHQVIIDFIPSGL